MFRLIIVSHCHVSSVIQLLAFVNIANNNKHCQRQ